MKERGGRRSTTVFVVDCCCGDFSNLLTAFHRARGLCSQASAVVCEMPELRLTQSTLCIELLAPALWLQCSADDTNLLVPENTDIPLSDEFSHIQLWVKCNGLIRPINFDKTKELVLHRPHPSKHSLPQSLEGIECVHTVKLL